MSAGEAPPECRRPGPTPRVEAGETALRIGCGRCTVDIVPSHGAFIAVAGDGVGSQPATAEITPATVALLLDLADTLDERTAWDTAAWPLAC